MFFFLFFFYKSIYFNYCTEGRDGSVWHYNHGAVDWSMGSRQPQQTHRRIQAWVGGKYSLPVASLHRRLCDNLRVTPMYCILHVLWKNVIKNKLILCIGEVIRLQFYKDINEMKAKNFGLIWKEDVWKT